VDCLQVNDLLSLRSGSGEGFLKEEWGVVTNRGDRYVMMLRVGNCRADRINRMIPQKGFQI